MKKYSWVKNMCKINKEEGEGEGEGEPERRRGALGVRQGTSVLKHAIPIGAVDGMPVGGQFLGRHFDEATMLRTAYALECALAAGGGEAD